MPPVISGQAAQAYHDGNPLRTPQMWFERMRSQLRHGSRIALSMSSIGSASGPRLLLKPNQFYDKSEII